jgi:hypothetical protein
MKWTGTALYLCGMILTSLNVYPLNLIFGALGGVMWCIVGLRAEDKPLWIVELASALIYLFGLLKWSLT